MKKEFSFLDVFILFVGLVCASVLAVGFLSRVMGVTNLSTSSPGAAQTSAFGQLNIAELTPLVQLKFPFNVDTERLSTTTANGGAASIVNSGLNATTSTNAAGSVVVESVVPVTYRAGQGILIIFAAFWENGCVADSDQEIGVGDDENGLFFACVDDVFGIIRRDEGTDNFTPQTKWNADKLIGDGAAFNLLINKGNVYTIQYQWLGYGMISFGVENPVNGRQRLVHRIQYANANTVPSMGNPNLPLRIKVSNDGNTTDLTIRASSIGAFVEGKEVEAGPQFTAEASLAAVTTEVAVFTIRSKTTFAGKTNRIRALFELVAGANTGTKNVKIRLVRNATLGGTPSFSDIDTINSIMEIDTSGTTVTGGTRLYPLFLSKDDGDARNLLPFKLYVNPGDTYTVSAESDGVAPSAVDASLLWKELR